MDSHFFWRRLHSLTGLFPVGFFLVFHLYSQLYLHAGQAAYNEYINEFYRGPLSTWCLLLLVYLPLFFHSVFGIKLSFEVEVQPQYKYFQHLLYWLQRLSGVGVLLFLLGHLWNAKFVPWQEGSFGDHYGHLWEGFHADMSLVTKTVYIFGILGACFHLANGINTFCITWGITLTPNAQQRMRNFSIFFFVLLSVMSFYAISAVW